MWQPSGRVLKLTPDEAREHIKTLSPAEALVFMRQSFVEPGDKEYLCINPTDDGRFTNHGEKMLGPKEGDAEYFCYALRDIKKGEEITMDYGGLPAPAWYKKLCYSVSAIPVDEVAANFPAKPSGQAWLIW